MNEIDTKIILEVKGVLELIKVLDGNDEVVKATLQGLSCPNLPTKALEDLYNSKTNKLEAQINELTKKLEIAKKNVDETIKNQQNQTTKLNNAIKLYEETKNKLVTEKQLREKATAELKELSKATKEAAEEAEQTITDLAYEKDSAIRKLEAAKKKYEEIIRLNSNIANADLDTIARQNHSVEITNKYDINVDTTKKKLSSQTSKKTMVKDMLPLNMNKSSTSLLTNNKKYYSIVDQDRLIAHIDNVIKHEDNSILSQSPKKINNAVKTESSFNTIKQNIYTEKNRNSMSNQFKKSSSQTDSYVYISNSNSEETNSNYNSIVIKRSGKDKKKNISAHNKYVLNHLLSTLPTKSIIIERAKLNHNDNNSYNNAKKITPNYDNEFLEVYNSSDEEYSNSLADYLHNNIQMSQEMYNKTPYFKTVTYKKKSILENEILPTNPNFIQARQQRIEQLYANSMYAKQEQHIKDLITSQKILKKGMLENANNQTDLQAKARQLIAEYNNLIMSGYNPNNYSMYTK